MRLEAGCGRRGSRAGGDVVTTVIEPITGAQVLPPACAEHATVTAWAAHVAMDADQRTKHPEWADLAARLQITGEETP